MIHLAEYTIGEAAFSSDKSVLYHGIRTADGTPVMIKLPRAGVSQAHLHAAIKEEFAIGRQLHHPGIVRYLALEEADGVPAIVTEFFGGVSLRGHIRSAVFSVDDFLKAAASIAAALGAIHAARVIHKDINPSNIVLNPETDEIRIIDFGAASRIRKEFIEAGNTFEQVTLPYLSPEQTGRANRLVTYRTDFYSLGITFYEMLAGRPPYESSDDAELIYAHLARPLPDLKALRPDVPETVIRIIRKLASKNPEDRYKGAAGLVADLERCRAEWTATGAVADWQPGASDISFVLQVPEKLYGREAELQQMISCMDAVRGGGIGILFVSGYSGIGKSSLVMELYSEVARRRGYFIAGKFDQFQRDIPYSAILGSYRQFLQHLLSEGTESLAVWKEKFVRYLGTDAGLVTAVLPELELLIGAQPPVVIEDPEKLKIRFVNAFRAFIRAISSDGVPLVIFLDDLQWVDLASLQLIMSMIGLIQPGEQHYILLVGAYRDNEVGPEHPLYLAIKDLEQKSIPIHRLELGPLRAEDINTLVAETLETPPQHCTALSGLIRDKTRGNPFFVNRFLDSLYDNGLVWFDAAASGWRWDIEGIRAADITDNVLHLIARNMATLAPATQEMLRIASCFGQRFTADDLHALSTQDDASLAGSLVEATDAGIIFKVKSETAGLYRFQHDRVQNAAYQLIGTGELAALHYRIGYYLLESAKASGTPDDSLFNILSHLNSCTELITGTEERRQMADYNLNAGRKARLSAAYQSALTFTQKGLEFLPQDAWTTDFRLAHALNLLGAECAYLLADHPSMHRYTDELLAHLSVPMQRLAVHEILGYSYSQRQMWRESMTESMQAVKPFGILIPAQPTKLDMMRYLASTMAQIRFMAPERFEELPPLNDPEIESVMRVLISSLSAAYLSDSNAFAVLVMAVVRLNVKHGNSIYAAYAYTAMGTLLGGGLGLMDLGYRYATAGKRIFDRHPHENSLAKVYFAFFCFADHWKTDLRTMFPFLMEGYQTGKAKGDIEYATWCLSHRATYSVLAGTNLHEMEEEFRMVIAACYDQKQVHGICNIYSKYVAWLLGNGQPEDDPMDAAWDDKETRRYEEISYRSALMQQHMLLGYRNLYYGKWEAAWHYASASARLTDAVVGLYYIPVTYFEQALAGIKLAGMGRMPLRKAKSAVAAFKKWAVLNPVNHGHKYSLIEAELAALAGSHTAAAGLYDAAIRGAQEHRHVQDLALICELAALYHRSRHDEAQFKSLLQQAYEAYARWGAVRLAQRLKREYPEALYSAGAKSADSTSISSGQLTSQALDMKAIIKASEVISGEMQLQRLLEKIIQVVVENAGAERVVLLLENEDGFGIAADVSPSAKTISVDRPAPLSGYTELASGVVQYVIRSRSFVVIEDAAADARFSAEPYIIRTSQRAILCLPLIKGGRMKAIVYLENKLMTGVFTPGRVETLNLLSAQAAIALENAVYYRDMHLAYSRIEQLNVAYERFVPRQFLSLLNRESITEIGLAEQSERDMPILFTDIRNFTAISERLSAQEVFNLLNGVLQVLIPCIQEAGGVIDKFIGDAIMALFPGREDDALLAAVTMNKKLDDFNESRIAKGLDAIRIGIGLHAGPMILGTVGSENRLNTTVIGDTVNIASRLETATKEFNASIIVSADMVARLKHPEAFRLRPIGYANVKGKSQSIRVFEEYSADEASVAAKKQAMAPGFEAIIDRMLDDHHDSAASLLREYCADFPEDNIADYYRKRMDRTLLPETLH